MKVVLKKNWKSHTVGQQIEISSEDYDYLIDNDIAVDLEYWEQQNESNLLPVLLKTDYAGSLCGDVIEVNMGIFDTLTQLGKAVAVEPYFGEDLSIDVLEMKIRELTEQNNELLEEIKVLESCKDKRTYLRKKKKNEKVL